MLRRRVPRQNGLGGKETQKGGGKDPGTRERSQDCTATWREMLGDTEEPWPIIRGRGECEQQHGQNWLGFLPDICGPAAIFLMGKDVNTWESTVGTSKCCVM